MNGYKLMRVVDFIETGGNHDLNILFGSFCCSTCCSIQKEQRPLRVQAQGLKRDTGFAGLQISLCPVSMGFGGVAMAIKILIAVICILIVFNKLLDAVIKSASSDE